MQGGCARSWKAVRCCGAWCKGPLRNGSALPGYGSPRGHPLQPPTALQQPCSAWAGVVPSSLPLSNHPARPCTSPSGVSPTLPFKPFFLFFPCSGQGYHAYRTHAFCFWVGR